MFGITTSWLDMPVESTVAARMPCSVPRATAVCWVEVSMPRTSISGPSRVPGIQDRFQSLPPFGPPSPPPGDGQTATRVVAVEERQFDLEVGVGKECLDRVAPFDEHDPSAIDDLLEPQIDDVLDPVQPIDVEMVDRDGSPVFANERERGGEHGLLHPQPASRALHQRSLPRSQVAGQGDDVAG